MTSNVIVKVVDIGDQEYYLKEYEDFQFLILYIEKIKKSNGCIEVVDSFSNIFLLNGNFIKYVIIIKGEKMLIRLLR